MELYCKTVLEESRNCLSLETSHTKISKELHTKNRIINEILEEQLLAIKQTFLFFVYIDL